MALLASVAIAAQDERHRDGLVNVRDHGAVGDGKTNDAPAIEKTIAGAPDGATILFPPGTYLISKHKGVEVKKRKGLTLLGRGATLKRDGKLAGNTRLMTVVDCEDMAMRDLAFDVNGIEKFGGMNVYTSKRFRVERCRAFDSNLKDTWQSYDHYSWVFQTCEDVWMRDCYAEDVELIEIDYSRRVWIVHNTCVRPAGTTAIGWFSVHSRAPGFDYHIEGNTIVDAPRQSIAVSLESGGQNHNVVRRFTIARNRIVHDKVPGGYGILVGNVSGPDPKGNTFANIAIEGNQFETSPGVKRKAPEIYLQASWKNPPEQHPFFTGVRIVGNTIYGGAQSDRAAIGVIHATRSTIARNRVFGVRNGIQVRHASACQVLDNQVEATGVAYSFRDSHGGNVWRGNQCVGAAPATALDRRGVRPDDVLPPVGAAVTTTAPTPPPRAKPPRPPAPKTAAGEAPAIAFEQGSFKIVGLMGPQPEAQWREGAGPDGGQALSLRYTSARENAGARLTWSFPPRVLDDTTYQLSLKPVGTAVTYLHVRFVHGRRGVARNTYFRVPAGRWSRYTIAVGQRGRAQYFEPKEGFIRGRPVSQIHVDLGGNAGKAYEVLVGGFSAVGGGKAPEVAPQAEPAPRPQGPGAMPGPAQAFAKAEHFQIIAVNGAPRPKLRWREKPGPSGSAALAVEFDSPRENAGVRFRWDFPAQVLDGRTFSLWVHTEGRRVPYLHLRFLAGGRQVCRYTYFGLKTQAWRQVSFPFDRRGKASYYEPKGELRPGQKISTIYLELGGNRGTKANRVLLSDFAVRGAASRLPGRPSTPPTVKGKRTAVWLSPKRGYALTGIEIAGRWLAGAADPAYPNFQFIDSDGERRDLDCTKPGWQTQAAAEGKGKYRVVYSYRGTTLELLWTAGDESVRLDLSVLSEGELKVRSVGADRMLGTTLGPGDYAIAPHGRLMRPLAGAARTYQHWGNSERPVPNFAAARVGDRIVFLNPLTASQRIAVAAGKAGGSGVAWLGTTLMFRPRDVKNPKTKLAHRTLSWKAEAAGDVNGDGSVDWVDCGIAYRDRYIRPNPNKSAAIRDSYRYYHGAHIAPNSYQILLDVIRRIVFATGVWWIKGMMVTNLHPVSEVHPYEVKLFDALGSPFEHFDAARKLGITLGPYYGHDYIDAEHGGWPPELIKLDPDGKPHRYYTYRGRQLYYKDNVRGLASGLLKKHYERIIQVCGLKPGDTIMLDTFTAHARPGYHPDYPATPQVVTDAKHEIARWLREDKGLIVAGEGIIEGTQDVVDYGAIVVNLRDWVRRKTWQRDDVVPMVTLVYHGSTYLGAGWYEFRNPDPNWAAALALGAGLWDWTSGFYPNLYEKTARYFFNQNIFWSRVADHKITDIDRDGAAYILKFENGAIVRADPEKNTHWLEEGGVRYDGFTPFSTRGVMAITRQGDIDITLPVRDMLEIIPSQPHRDRLDIKITRAGDGRVRVSGNFSKIPWKSRHHHRRGDREVTDTIDVEPVLMLRRVAARKQGE